MGKRKPKLCRTNLQRVSQNSRFSFNRERIYLCPTLLIPLLFLTEKRSWKANPWIGLQLSCVEDQRVLLQMISRSILTCHSSYKDEEGLDCFYRPNAGTSRALRPSLKGVGSVAKKGGGHPSDSEQPICGGVRP